MADGPNVSGMIADPDFQKLSPADKRSALGKLTGDSTFGSLSDADTMQFVSKMQAAKPQQPANPINQQFSGATSISANNPGIVDRIAAMQVPGTGVSIGEAAGRAKQFLGMAGTEAGLLFGAPAAVAAPGATIGGLAGGYLGGKGAKAVTAAAGGGENAQALAEFSGQTIGGLAGGVGGSKLQAAIPSKDVAAQFLNQARAKAGNAPVELSAKTNEILDDIVSQGKLGGKVPKVISDLLERVGPNTKLPADAQPGPLTYNEARILQSNASQLSAEEKMALKGDLKRLIPQFAKSFSADIQEAANNAGVGAEHSLGMQQYAKAARLGNIQDELADMAKQSAINTVKYGGGTAVGGYLLKKILGK